MSNNKSSARVILNRILAKPLSSDAVQLGAIFVPTNAYGQYVYAAKVVAVGPDLLKKVGDYVYPARINKGDTILLGISPIGVKAGVAVTLEDGPHVVVKEDDVLVVL